MFSGPIYTKVKAALIAAALTAALALIDQLGAVDLGFLGPWAVPAGAALAAIFAYAKKEVAGLQAGPTPGPPAPVQIPPPGFTPDADTLAALAGEPTHLGEVAP